MIAIAYAQFAIFFIYTFFVWRKYGIQRSISESWYAVDKQYKWMFTMFCFGLGITQCFHGTVWFFLSGSFLCFVGVAFDFKSRWRITPWVHNVGAAGSIVLGTVGLAVLGIWWPFIPIVLAVFLLRKENHVWWIEVVAFFSILGGLIQRYL